MGKGNASVGRRAGKESQSKPGVEKGGKVTVFFGFIPELFQVEHLQAQSSTLTF